MGLYDAVRKEQPRRRFHPLWAAALVFAVALVTVLGLVISKPQRDHDRFVQCMSEISSSTAYALARKHTNLQAQVDGQSLRITQETAMPCTASCSTWAPYSAGMCPRAGASAWTTATAR